MTMDPNACLERIRRLAKNTLAGDGDDDEYAELAEACEALDEWLRRGGFMPEDWSRTKKTPAELVCAAYLEVPEYSPAEEHLEAALACLVEDEDTRVSMLEGLIK